MDATGVGRKAKRSMALNSTSPISRARLAGGLLAIFMAIAAGAQAETTAPVKLDTGRVSGVAHDGVEAFKGIPFAAPPVGPLRWRAPQPAAPWSGVRAAERFGFACMQAPRPGALRVEDMSEDCLTLNVWRPANARGKKLPVMVWFYGGSFVVGSAAEASSGKSATSNPARQ